MNRTEQEINELLNRCVEAEETGESNPWVFVYEFELVK